jgi:hypothetical protein
VHLVAILLSNLFYGSGMKRDNVHVDKGSSTVFGGDHKRVKLETAEPEFPKLNQSDPAHARRIQQRRRMVSDSVKTWLQYRGHNLSIKSC